MRQSHPIQSRYRKRQRSNSEWPQSGYSCVQVVPDLRCGTVPLHDEMGMARPNEPQRKTVAFSRHIACIRKDRGLTPKDSDFNGPSPRNLKDSDFNGPSPRIGGCHTHDNRALDRALASSSPRKSPSWAAPRAAMVGMDRLRTQNPGCGTAPTQADPA